MSAENIDITKKSTEEEVLDCKVGECWDKLYYCYTLGHQALHYYRYGTKKDCSEQWKDLKLCFKVKTKSEEVAKKMLSERKAEKDALKVGQKSSLDVWTERDAPPANFPPQDV
ncbi:hypothetical protein K493DRAFT_267967 [Basidiobolus meristosporus CBS 931.73]|uniref:Early meiotic induction protein 1 n=1 Tax=Basidiobolus meristosporus CBS 931.73 TaxID=1314790 RepID=A0A1Y1XSL2_9FUNG|nr:hypothetical protein K493DRAFT_267967 [Basidiobolus meristosporus CBS 931.73]|eukprot:ORX88731.1 hypothetical protein K493DRAFT_267967 [Basidiobolus meristosporus CBS 931.73]